ncbi:MAG: hypothetical protein HY012_05030 [Acidobacteria bacterium]|nr:hypothetical protein [Acidobacteriota bacterium]
METILPGLRGMLNWHPLFVHFPIALWVGALIFEAIAVLRSSEDWHKSAARLLYLGTLCGLAAAGTGLLAEESVPAAGPAHDAFEIHETLMYVTMSAAVGLCGLAFFKRNSFSAGMRKTLMTLGADRGAQLVYQYGVSVDWSKANPKK